ncbi:MAG: metallophosphoesterase family protein [Verrucomicrobiota bacterium JB025]|nr:DNA repair exonuclease [Verrucomicrobiota bacterium JB025]
MLHTADNHIGLSFNRYPEAVRDRLLDERFAALERLVATANERQADFFVVAGDLFDKVGVAKSTVVRAVDLLREFTGEAVLVLAGNHDYCEGPDSKLWKWFRTAADGSPVIALTDKEVRDFEGDDYRVRFYACPCASKHSREHVIGWVADEEKADDRLHVGIAHGNVDGLGLDADQRYFNMSENELRGAGLDAWLLGHIHVPAPATGTTGRPLYFMPGIHTPDSVKCSHGGHAWWIELGDGGACGHELLSPGALRFIRISRELRHVDDIAALKAECEALDAPRTVLDLQLSGRLKEGEISALNGMLQSLEGGFLHFSREQDIAPALDAAAIARRFPEGTLPNSLLQELLADEDAHPGDAHLALEIIESL